MSLFPEHGRPGAVAFDLDGTLVDSVPDLQAAAEIFLAERGHDGLDRATITGFVGNGVPVLVERMLRQVGETPDAAALAPAVARYSEIYGAAPSALSETYPGVAEALAGLQDRGLALGVCTNKPAAPARRLLADLGIARYISALVGGDSLPQRKPDPAPLKHLAELLGAGPGGLVYVGDSEVDAATAAAAGVPFVLFTRGYRKVPVEDLPHQARFDDFAELAALLAAEGAAEGRPGWKQDPPELY